MLSTCLWNYWSLAQGSTSKTANFSWQWEQTYQEMPFLMDLQLNISSLLGRVQKMHWTAVCVLSSYKVGQKRAQIMPQYQLCRRLCDNHTPRICIRLDKVKKKKERRKKEKKEKNPCALQHVVHATKIKSKYSYGVQFP